MGLIGTVGNIDLLNVGGVQFVDFTNLKVLTATVNATKYSTFISGQFGSTSYQVTTGKTLRVLAIQVFQTGAVTSCNVGYGDTDNGLNNAVAPTNAQQAFSVIQVPAAATTSIPIFMLIPALKYPYVQAGAVNISSITMYGYEV